MDDVSGRAHSSFFPFLTLLYIPMDALRVSLIQTDIVWEDKEANLLHCADALAPLAGQCDVAVLPEMFSTGFSMNAEALAEPVDGTTIATVKQWASEYGMAIAGSYIARDERGCFNRAFFITPEGEEHYYDKKHLFRMGEEGKHFLPGNERPIIHYKGWNILLLVCYDLRFPVWCRNVDNEYDLLLFVASWPEPRAQVWRSLLVARAIENLAYVCGVNRVGEDGASLLYRGDTMAIGVKGNTLAEAEPRIPQIIQVTLSLSELHTFRQKFPAWKDADPFTLG